MGCNCGKKREVWTRRQAQRRIEQARQESTPAPGETATLTASTELPKDGTESNEAS
jgi:hypothetical protein